MRLLFCGRNLRFLIGNKNEKTKVNKDKESWKIVKPGRLIYISSILFLQSMHFCSTGAIVFNNVDDRKNYIYEILCNK